MNDSYDREIRINGYISQLKWLLIIKTSQAAGQNFTDLCKRIITELHRDSLERLAFEKAMQESRKCSEYPDLLDILKFTELFDKDVLQILSLGSGGDYKHYANGINSAMEYLKYAGSVL